MVSKRSNMSNEEKLLYEILKQLDRLTKVMGTIASNTVTTTTTIAP